MKIVEWFKIWSTKFQALDQTCIQIHRNKNLNSINKSYLNTQGWTLEASKNYSKSYLQIKINNCISNNLRCPSKQINILIKWSSLDKLISRQSTIFLLLSCSTAISMMRWNNPLYKPNRLFWNASEVPSFWSTALRWRKHHHYQLQ